MAAKLDAGITWVNGWALLDPAVPFGGVKASGWGREYGPEALASYQRTNSIVFNLAREQPGDRRPGRSARGARRARSSSDVDFADPAPGEVLVKLVASGMCHTDLGVIAGGIPFAAARNHRARRRGGCGRGRRGRVLRGRRRQGAAQLHVVRDVRRCRTATPPTARRGCRAICSGICGADASGGVTRHGERDRRSLLRPVLVRRVLDRRRAVHREGRRGCRPDGARPAGLRSAHRLRLGMERAGPPTRRHRRRLRHRGGGARQPSSPPRCARRHGSSRSTSSPSAWRSRASSAPPTASTPGRRT